VQVQSAELESVLSADVCFKCGDGRRSGPEACDDGNTRGADGCSAGCALERGFACVAANASSADRCYAACLGLNCSATCRDLHALNASAPSGRYSLVTPTGASVTAYCDMDTGSGGYMSVACDALSTGSSSAAFGGRCTTTCYSTSTDSCTAVGLQMVVPRTRAHMAALITRYDMAYFSAVPGVSLSVNARGSWPAGYGPYTTCAMNSDGGTCAQWQALDGRDWWIRGSGHYEPNGDYSANGWLGMQPWGGVDNIYLFDSGSWCTDRYVCSDNAKSSCGDGRLRADLSEACDDGNALNGDGCSSACAVEDGYSCRGGSATLADVCQKCGDGRVSGTETCDDWNLADEDGCSATCVVEVPFECPTSCMCGNVSSHCNAYAVRDGSSSVHACVDCRFLSNVSMLPSVPSAAEALYLDSTDLSTFLMSVPASFRLPWHTLKHL
jgi:cysteine-rich repeat protein